VEPQESGSGSACRKAPPENDSSGIGVVDAKNYAGAIEVRDVGGWFRTDLRLYVANRDRSKLVAAMTKQETSELLARNLPPAT
jgi:hypothetical protein